MGSSEVDDTPASLKVINYLNELCAYALSIGMTLKEYWEDEPSLIVHYIEAEKIRQKKRNHELWLQGAYIYQAIGGLYPLFNPFSKEHKAKPYPSTPFPIDEQDRQQQLDSKVEKFMDNLIGRKPKG